MYYDYFGLKQPPFRITPDTSLFYPGGDRGAVLDALVYAILNGEGMVKVVGEVGSGKTMLCRMLEKELPDKVEIVYLANPSLSPENILHAIAFELKLEVAADTSRLQVMHSLQEYLLARHASNRQVVVFVEEAQAMPIATLEEIRLLSNLETQQSKLLQIVLFGQPELDELIANPEIRQLKERITYSFQLNPFMSEHIRDYLNTRLRASGYRAGEVFDKGAIRKIERYSRGLLRRVNILADKAMLAAYAGNTNKVSAGHVDQAARDSEFVSSPRRLLWGALIAASVLLVCIALIGAWQYRQAGQAAGPPAATSQSVSPAPNAIEPGQGVAQEEARVSANQPPLGLQSRRVDTGLALEMTIAAPATASGADKAPPATADVDEVSPGEDVSVPPGEARPGPATVLPATARTAAPLSRGSTGSEEQLLDLTILFELQDLGDARLSEAESRHLRRQLKDLPPEVALYQDSAQFSDICKLCWSILYRPVAEAENL